MLLTATLSGCAGPAAEATSGAAPGPGPWEVVAAPPPAVAAAIAARGPGGRLLRQLQPTVVYLNFDGALLHAGADSDATADTSWWLPHHLAYPAFAATGFALPRAEAILVVVARLEETFAGLDLRLTLARPAVGDYMMVMIGGGAALLGLDPGILGVAPQDCLVVDGEADFDRNPRDVVFVFGDDVGAFGLTLFGLADVIAHEMGHALGLAHVERPGDVMNACIGRGEVRSWGSGVIAPTTASCSVDGFQDDLAVLTLAVGETTPGPTPPTLAVTAPAAGAVVTGPLSVETAAGGVDGDDDDAWVDLFVDGTWAGRSAGPRAAFAPLDLPPGAHSLRGRLGTWDHQPVDSPAVAVFVPAPPAAPCAADVDCEAGARCQGGACAAPPPAPVGGALGAACATDADCVSGRCLDEGGRYCSHPCRPAVGAGCPAGYACGSDDLCHSRTPLPPGVIGAPCAADAECQHLLCLGAPGAGYCSAACRPERDLCPAATPCGALGDGRHACQPPGAGGCRVARTALPGAGLPLLLALAAARRRRRAPGRRRRRDARPRACGPGRR